jgi:hypothetical protein
VDFADAAAHNEEVFRSINERIEEGAKQHGVEQLLPFHCECATEACLETIELPPAEYDRIASHRARFVVVPGHEQASVETVVERHSGYLIVEKSGEARAEIEREHPRPAITSDRGHHVRSPSARARLRRLRAHTRRHCVGSTHRGRLVGKAKRQRRTPQR